MKIDLRASSMRSSINELFKPNYTPETDSSFEQFPCIIDSFALSIFEQIEFTKLASLALYNANSKCETRKANVEKWNVNCIVQNCR